MLLSDLKIAVEQNSNEEIYTTVDTAIDPDVSIIEAHNDDSATDITQSQLQDILATSQTDISVGPMSEHSIEH